MKTSGSELARKRVVVYVRVSLDLQDSDNQKHTIERFAEANGIKIHGWYKDDEGYNPRGDGLDRPQFQAMYQDAKEGKFDAVLVAYQERLGLLGDSWGYWSFMFRKVGVSFWEAKGDGKNLSSQDPATIERTARDTADSMGWLIKHGTKVLNARIKSGMDGDYHGGPPPYYCDVACYDPTLTRVKYRLVYHNRNEKTQIIFNEQGKEIDRRSYTGKHQHPQKDKGDRLRLAPTIQTERIEIIRRIFHWYQTESISMAHIVGRLNTMNIPSYLVPCWTSSGLKEMMLNPAVIGMPAQCKFSHSRYAERYDDGGVDKRPDSVIGQKRGLQRNVPTDWASPYEQVFAPIIAPDIYWAVFNKIMGNKRGGKKPSRKAIAWLTGFLYCARCGYHMNYCTRQTTKNGKVYQYENAYRCGSYQGRGNNLNPFGCKAHLVKASVLEGLVEQWLTDTQQKTGFDARVKADVTPIPIEGKPICFGEPDPEHKQRLLLEKQRLKDERATIIKRALRLGLDKEEEAVKEELRETELRIADLEAELKQMDERLTEEEYNKRISDALTTIREGTDRAKKEALSKVLERIDLHFEHTANGSMIRYRLAKVVFTPITPVLGIITNEGKFQLVGQKDSPYNNPSVASV